MASSGLEESDKAFWHRFTEVYDAEFAHLGKVRAVLEFGVWKGSSIQWLADRFPEARIVGCDIVPQEAEWPSGERFMYAQMDQGNPAHIRAVFQATDGFDLIIDDGSHYPEHQRNCLVEALPHLRPGGIYVLEDIHTSHPRHVMFMEIGRPGLVGPLQLLLALEHLKATGQGLNDVRLDRLTTNSLFSREDVQLVFARCARIRIFKRATLPHRCYRCGGDDYDFGTLVCRCGVQLYHHADSMTAVLHVR